MSIKICNSNRHTSSTVINALMKIEEEVYSLEYRGDYMSTAARFNKFKNMFIFGV